MNHDFSNELKTWLESDHPKTLGGLIAVFSEKSFGVACLALMALPALPLPTGGVSHLVEIIAALIALELIAGRQQIWLPQRWHRFSIKSLSKPSTTHKVIRLIRWFESRHYLGRLPRKYDRLIGAGILVFATAAFLAPIFSGLDTLPSMGAVILSLALILENRFLFILGWLVGTSGIALIAALGSVVFKLF